MVEQVDERLEVMEQKVHMEQQVEVELKLVEIVEVIQVLINLMVEMVQVHMVLDEVEDGMDETVVYEILHLMMIVVLDEVQVMFSQQQKEEY